MKKLLSVVLVLVLALSFAGCKKDTPAPETNTGAETETGSETEAPATGGAKIGVTIANFDDTFLTYMMDGMKAYGAEKGADMEFVDAKEDMAKQMDQVENFIVQQKDAIIVVPVDTSAAGPMTAAANEAGIPIVYVNRVPSELPDGTYYVGSDSLVAGQLQMEYLVGAIGEEAKIVILQGKLDNEAALKRTEGNEMVAAQYPGIEILDKQTGEWQRNEGMMVTEDWLNKYGETLDAIVCNNDDMALGAIQALKDGGLNKEILVVGVDATPDGLAALEAGTLAATVFQDAAGQGGGGVEVALKAIAGESVDKETWIPFILVTPENLADFK